MSLSELVARDEAERLATHDHLTGLPNRRLLEDRMAEAIRRAKRTVASRIGSCVREYDTVARFGGDEFFLLIRGVDLDCGIEVLAKRILDAVARPLRIGESDLTPTLSVGIAEYSRHGEDKDALMLASDHALYAAKRAGRNCFRIAREMSTEGR
jgi:diguanylate cyclase (GGDEF)-like protein